MSREYVGIDTLASKRVTYRTRGLEVNVEFARQTQTVATLEGPVRCEVGDAIVTGVQGERWPVPALNFQEKYVPVEGQALGSDGRYRKKILRVQAIQLVAPLDIELSGNRGVLHGAEGDWCVWYGSDDMAIVNRDVFLKSYELDSVPVYVALAKDLSPTEREKASEALRVLSDSFPKTSIAVLDERTSSQSEIPVWFRIVSKPHQKPLGLLKVIELPAQCFMEPSVFKDALARIQKANGMGVGSYFFSRVRNFFSGLCKTNSGHDSLVAIVAEQLVEVDRFNSDLASDSKPTINEYFLNKRDAELEPVGLARIQGIGAVADYFATDYQSKWQRLVLATTKEIADVEAKGVCCAIIGVAKYLFLRRTLVSFGVWAALSLAAFSEFSGGCKADDYFAFLGCASKHWEPWFELVSAAIYFSSLAVAWKKYAEAKIQKWEARHQDYRLLAESLRVLYVRSLLGQTACVARDLPRAEPTASGWVKLALRSIFHAQPTMSVSNNEAARIAGAKTCFIDDQLDYHRVNLIDRRESAIALISCVGRWAFLLFALALIALFFSVLYKFFTDSHSMPIHWVLFLQLTGIAVWGAMRKVIDTFAWEQEVQRGELVRDVLLDASQGNDPVMIRSAADFFLKDLAAWHALHRSRPIEAAIGG
ncbi:PGDYG protein [Propionivibrio dicarboxylicus]|uniref:PGDYG protein n=2 Tax=Propionivibrio dicarboxylicus TaxID=83767 RepID=A0A1G8N3R8_9RHOO|nr:PGDYG protein [Propionivibrio dicarboxylicus]